MNNIDKKAIEHLNQSLEINSEYLPSLFLLTEFYIDNEQYELAELNLEKIETIDSKHAKLWFLKSKTAFKKEDYIEAKRFIDLCLAKKFYTEEILHLALSLASIQNNNKDKVMILENWILHHDADYDKYLELAKSLDQPNQYDKALYYFQLARDLQPNEVNVLVAFARFYLFAKKECTDGSVESKADYTKSKDLLFAVLAIKQDMDDALFLLGEVYFREKNFIKAREYFTACYDRNFNKCSFLLKLAEIAGHLSQTKIQEKILVEATLDPKIEGKALTELFKLKSKGKKREKVLLIGYKALVSLRRTIRVLQKNLKYQIAANNFVESKRITNEISTTYEEVSEVYFQCSRIVKSKRSITLCIDRSIAFNPQNVKANFCKGILLNNESTKCIAYFKTCIENEWNHWEARWHYLKLTEKEMTREEVISHLQTILDCNPDHNEARIYLNKLVFSNPD